MIARLDAWPRLAGDAPEEGPAAPPAVVTVYVKAGCGCCGKALEVLSGVRERTGLGFEVEVVRLEADAALMARYGGLAPVVEVHGKVRFKGVVNPVLLERLLRAEGDARPSPDAPDSPPSHP